MKKSEQIVERYHNRTKWEGYTYRVWVDGNGDRVVDVQTAPAVMFEHGASYAEVYRGDEDGVVPFIRGDANHVNQMIDDSLLADYEAEQQDRRTVGWPV